MLPLSYLNTPSSDERPRRESRTHRRSISTDTSISSFVGGNDSNSSEMEGNLAAEAKQHYHQTWVQPQVPEHVHRRNESVGSKLEPLAMLAEGV